MREKNYERANADLIACKFSREPVFHIVDETRIFVTSETNEVYEPSCHLLRVKLMRVGLNLVHPKG